MSSLPKNRPFKGRRFVTDCAYCGRIAIARYAKAGPRQFIGRHLNTVCLNSQCKES